MAFIIHISEEVQLIAPPPSKVKTKTEEGVISTLLSRRVLIYV